MARTSAVSSSTRAEPMTVSTFVAPDDLDAVTELLRAQLESLPARSPLYADHFAEHGVTPAAFSSLDDLRKFPFTTKQMLRDSQAAAPPLGRHAGVPMSEVVRVHASTGTTGRPSWVGVTRRDADMAPVLFGEAPGSGGMRFTGGRHVAVELIDPDSGDPVGAEPGATGELVYTAVDRECCPLVRFRTRDRVVVTGRAADGAPLIRCVGRIDDMLIVLGVNVFPSAIRDLVQTLHPRTTGAVQIVLPAAGPRVEPPLPVDVEWGGQPGDREQLARDVEALILN